ncbi:MAG TPA: TetR/AcrR family transcriptional regulator [Patescibacteria group bacterium]|nr:TetR/AcrR family transcriptional regulator [Patescibacteria group bacterium]
MPREYRARARAESAQRTRERILATALDLVGAAHDVPVDAIASAAGVSVQTLYTHFGSKRGLLLALIDTAQRNAGLYVDFDHVWQSADGETALRRMLDATFRLWEGAWPLVEFSERARRADPEIGRVLREVDGYRTADLRAITERLASEERLRNTFDRLDAAEFAFALSTPSVYSELVVVRAWSRQRATEVVTNAIVRALVDEGIAAVTTPPADWSSVVRPEQILATEAITSSPPTRTGP